MSYYAANLIPISTFVTPVTGASE